MKRFYFGLLVGILFGLLVAGTVTVAADIPIKLIVNGAEVNCGECPPQIVNGYTLVPARALAESLGATVLWDEVGNAVIITSKAQPASDTSSATPGSTSQAMPQTVTQGVSVPVGPQTGQLNTVSTEQVNTQTTPVKNEYPAPEPGKTPISFDAETKTYRYLEDEPSYKDKINSQRKTDSNNGYTEFHFMEATKSSTGSK